MTVGTRSVLFGVHAFWLHPFFVVAAWWKLYGFPADLRLWIAFFVHDLGYIGKPNMDGSEGEKHPEYGAEIMGDLFGPEWFDFVLFHSRYYVRRFRDRDTPYFYRTPYDEEWRDEPAPSRLCCADKLAIALTPAWIYLPMARLSGELDEYLDPDHHEGDGKYAGEGYRYEADPAEWYEDVRAHMRGWVEGNCN